MELNPQDAASETSIYTDLHRKVLLIEDNPLIAETLSEVLGLLGHIVQSAPDGLQGLQKARAFHPEMVLCDIGLPGMDGYAVARAFRADESLRDSYLVALTGYRRSEDVRAAAAAGFDRHMVKPISLEDIDRLLSEAPVRFVVQD
jgi:CheY-like chemotaxis protein